MSEASLPRRPALLGNTSPTLLILSLATVSGAIYLTLALSGDLRLRPLPLLSGQAVLLAGMLAAWNLVRRRRAGIGWVVGAALVFRLVAALGEPALSDDVYRYVWDGRVQLHGVHPYARAPLDPALEPLRDEGWRRINHPWLETIYPPVAEAAFFVLAALGADQTGFRLVFGVIDFGVVLLLLRLLRLLRLPRDRITLYAWNPLAVLETSGSGHLEPLGVALVLLATLWVLERRDARSTLPLAAAVHVKLVPVVLIPVFFRRYRPVDVGRLVGWFVFLWLPYALTGPAFGAGLRSYAAHWEWNGSVFPIVRALLTELDTGRRLEPVVTSIRHAVGADRIPWHQLYAAVWPDTLARASVGLALLVWIAVVLGRCKDNIARQSFLVLTGVVVLSPTVHPWYVLWVLPFAVVYLSWPWIAFAGVLTLAYLGAGGQPPLWVSLVEYGVLFGGLSLAAVGRRARTRLVDGRAGVSWDAEERKR